MNYQIKLKFPAVFNLARLLKITNAKESLIAFLDSDLNDVQGKTQEEIQAEVMKNKTIFVEKILELFLSIAGSSPKAKDLTFEFLAEVSNVKVEEFEDMDISEMINFFKAFAEVEGLSAFFGQASNLKG